MRREILITGLGVVSPGGADAASTWRFLISGGRAVRSLEGLPGMAGRGWLGAPAAGVSFDTEPGRPLRLARQALRELAAEGSIYYIKDTLGDLRICHHVGTSKTLDPLGYSFGNSHYKNPNTFYETLEGLEGSIANPRLSGPVAACATGTLAVCRAAAAIEDGDADAAFAGGADASLHPLWLACYERLGVLAPRHENRGESFACRPFDAARAGFVAGEGAGILRLEAATHPNQSPICRISGWARGTDPAGLTQVSEDGEPLAHVIRLALDRAGCRPNQLACIHAHGTGTPANDLAEARALRLALGDAARRIPIVSLKGSLGHLLGAAGGVELAVAAMACRERMSPGNTTLLEVDAEMSDLIFPREAFGLQPGPILKLALGFGGHLAAVVLDS